MGICGSKEMPPEPKIVPVESGPQLSPEQKKYLLKNTGHTQKEFARMYKNFMNSYSSGRMPEEAFVEIFKGSLEKDRPSGDCTGYCRILFRACGRFETPDDGRGKKVEPKDEFDGTAEVLKRLEEKEKGTKEVKIPTSLSFCQYARGLFLILNPNRTTEINWSFQIYDANSTGVLTYDDFLVVQKEIYKMFGHFPLPDDEKTAELRCQKIFKMKSKDWQVDTFNKNDFIRLCNSETGDFELASLWKPAESMARRG